MKNRISVPAILACLLMCTSFVHAQSTLETVLANVAQNNKAIKAYDQYVESKKLEYKTGMYLENPTLEYDFMLGSPSNAGNQTDITAVQSFDFPSAYSKRKALSNANTTKLDITAQEYRQDILLETKMVYLEIVYLNKRKIELSKRLERAEKMQQAFQEKYEKGDANMLDINKAKISLARLKNDSRHSDTRIQELHQKLTQLNGGIEISVSESSYPIVVLPPSFPALFEEALKGDFQLLSIQQDQEISKRNEGLNKALSLPKLEGGYRYQTVLGQTFNGIHAGISIPLFENKNKVQASRQRTSYFQLLEESHANKHQIELEALFNKAKSLRKSMAEYKDMIENANSEKLLAFALDVGELSSIEYFMELSFYYDAYDAYLEIEKDYSQLVADLLKYQLGQLLVLRLI